MGEKGLTFDHHQKKGRTTFYSIYSAYILIMKINAAVYCICLYKILNSCFTIITKLQKNQLILHLYFNLQLETYETKLRKWIGAQQ